MELNLQFFAGHSVTVYKDAGFSAASASPNSSVAAEADVTLSWTLASGKELDEIEIVSGGAIEIDMDTKKFEMPDADVVLNFKSKANNTYMVVENTVVNINGTKTTLNRNMKLKTGATGAIIGVESDGSSVTIADTGIVARLVADGILVKM